MIFSASSDGEVAIFDRDFHGDFNLYRSVSMKKMNPSATISTLCYQEKRNTAIIGTNTGEIFFVDIDKNKIISQCDTKAGDIEKFVHFEQDNILLSFSKKAKIFGLYLPPHIKKFKPSCHLVSEQSQSKISSVVMSEKNKRSYIGFENGDLMSFWLNQEVIADSGFEDRENSKTIRNLWKANFGESIRNVILI
jgi:hypothetical protein